MIYLRRLFRKADKLLAEDSQQPTLTRKAVN